MKIFEIKNLRYSYPSPGRDGISIDSFSISRGELVLVIGPSGCGKSTFARLFCGIVPRFYGGDISYDVMQGQKACMVFQDPEKQLVMNSVERDIAFGMENMGYERLKMKRRVAEVLSYLNISDIRGRRTCELSGGQKQKVAIGGVIAMGSDFIVLDEITSQLDPKSAQEVLGIVKSLNEDMGYTVILIEQRLDRVFDMADRIVFMESGRIAFDGGRQDFLKSDCAKKGPFMPPISEFFSRLGIYDIWNVKSGRQRLAELGLDGTRLPVLKLESPKSEDGMSAKNAAVEVESLKFSYAGTRALEGASLRVEKGEALAIIGENGSGKSTLLKGVCKLIECEGRIEVDGEIGYLSQNPNDYLFNDTVYDELMFTANKKKLKNVGEAVEETLSRLDIQRLKGKNPRDLSGGERQRVALGSILVHDPEIVIMDEPTRGLDTIQKERIGSIISDLKGAGKSVIVVTHDMEFVARHMDTVALMAHGAVVDKSEKHRFFSESINYSTDIKRLLRGICEQAISIKDFDFGAKP